MLCLNLKSTDPYLNLATEEYLLKGKREDYLLLYTDSPSVIIGKHQVAHRETNSRFVYENNIPVIRRISGGGTVYHDSGNLNFSFIAQSTQGKQVDFRKYTIPVIEFLKNLGVVASFEGKNDLRVNGMKISGNAEHVYHERVLHHGTILFGSDLHVMRNSLRKDIGNYSTRAVNSNPSSVMNLREMLPEIDDINELRDRMIKFFLDKDHNNKIINLSENELDKIGSGAVSKYRTWEWNYAYGPEYKFVNNFEIGSVPCSCSLYVKNGVITECDIEGTGKMRRASGKLIGCRHMIPEMYKILNKEEIFMDESDIFNFF